ncbi:MAG: exodeoxyribonuclease VII small subunit [Candidatus Omnitrophica bacterium]|jgi:exodeoxyribonuclease VII small subunit|nr:exodeoxyribonuclease VII small subunit [Candidatus Omnitrophota bacterium]
MKEKINFEDDLKRLQKIVDELASGKLTLGESLKKYEEGVKLAKSCACVLEDAQRKVELLMKKDSGFKLEDFDDSQEEGK